MPFFDWNDELATGIPRIDEQHRKLISLVNELHDALSKGKSRDVLGKLLQELADYTNYHFKTEERAFAAYRYENADAHKRSHDDLVRQLQELVEKHARGSLAVGVETLTFLIDWVKNHIMKEDRLYIPCLKGKAIE
jgi:hemerythrin